MAKHRWIIERDYQGLKLELGLGHLKGADGEGSTTMPLYVLRPMRTWNRLSPSAAVGHIQLPILEIPPDYRPRGSRPSRAT